MFQLVSVMDDLLDVYLNGEHVGSIDLMCDGWAAYRKGQTARLGTHPNIMRALMALKETI